MSRSEGAVLVTGAAGFIGSHTAEALLRAGRSVVALDSIDGFYDPALKHANLEEIRRTAGGAGADFRFVHADIRDTDAVRRVFDEQRIDGVVHLAARAGVRPSIAEPVLYADVNVVGTSVLLECAARAGCSRFVCASSSSVYGNNEKVPFSEDDPADDPISPYASTKRACELIGRTAHHLTGMPVAMLRFFTVYGPRQRPDLAIARFLSLVSAGRPVTLFGDGTMSRDYTYIDDIVAGVLAAYERIPGHGWRIWNLGGSRPVTLADMLAAVERTVGRAAVIDRRPEQPGDVRRTCADTARSRHELGFRPTVPFEEGLRRQWEWTRRAAQAPAHPRPA